jgi:hypothetical protein
MVGAGAAAWWIWGRETHAPLPATSPTDDLELVVALLDGAATEPPRDRLVAGRDERYLARAADRTLVAFGADGGPPRPLATLDAPAHEMALASGALWVTAGHAVEKVPLAGGPPVVVASNFAKPLAVAADGRWVFVVDVEPGGGGLTHANTILRVPATGSDRVVLGRSEGEVTNVAIDDDTVYWADRLEGTIVAVAKAGGAPRVLASDRGLPGAIAADADTLYWVEKRSESLWAMPKAGGAPRQLTQDFAGFANVVVAATAVAWTNEAAVDGSFRVLSVAKTGGDVALVSQPVDSIDALATDGTRLFWSRAAAVSVVP